MFTGIVRCTGEVVRKVVGADGARFQIRAEGLEKLPDVGASISVDGVCLTVAEKGSGGISVDVSPETLRRSTLGEYVEGSRLNLEPALKVSDFLGGHLVQGHVDDTGTLLSVHEEGNSQVFRISAPEHVLRYCVLKGSIAVNGVSLTVSGLSSEWFEVTIIPHTLVVTNFSELVAGDRVNLEADIISKYVESHLGAHTS